MPSPASNHPTTIPNTTPGLWPDVAAGRMASLITADPAQMGACRVALLGLPDDLGVRLNNGRPGAAQGPRAFRAALAGYGVAEPDGLNEGGWPRVFDAGDVVPALGDDAAALTVTHQRITEAALALHKAGLFPIAIGGGHDLTFPFVRAAVLHFKKPGGGESFGGTYFDAHLDVRPTVGSGMPFRKLIEECGVGPLTVVGLNPLANSREHTEWFEAHGGTIEPHDGGRQFVRVIELHDTPPAPPLLHTFVSFDLDAIDAAHAPGVSAMNPAGMTVVDAAARLRAAAADPTLRCLDIMELSPPHDDKNRTARVAAHLFLHALMGLKLGREIEER